MSDGMLKHLYTTRFTHVVGIGGIGGGVLFELEGDHTLGREESRPGRVLSARDYCKLHIVEHYIAVMTGSGKTADGYHVLAIGVVGDDATGHQLLREMEDAGIGTEWVRTVTDRKTLFSVTFLYPDGTGGNITANNSAAAALDLNDIRNGERVMERMGPRCVAICLPEVPIDIRQEFLKLATRSGNYRAASFTCSEIQAAIERELFSMVDLLALNREESAELVGYEYTSENAQRFLSDCASLLLKMQPHIRIVVSLGAEGVHSFEQGVWHFQPAPPVDVISTAGAGDALLAGVVSGLAAGMPFHAHNASGATFKDGRFHTAMELGVLLASFSVTSPDTIHFGADLAALQEFASALTCAK
jgi:sugar/nucleoside kinase (ribokinase family)